MERSANVEAIAILNKAVATLDLVPDRARLRDQEFAILTTLGSALGATKGYGAPETKECLHEGARHLNGNWRCGAQTPGLIWRLGQFLCYGSAQRILEITA